jgi:TolB protein
MTRLKLSLCIMLMSFCVSSFAQSDTLGVFTGHTDVGNPKNMGNSQYNKETHTYTITGSGYNIWFNRDEFQFLFKQIKGDFTATANFQFMGPTGNNHRKIGWMIRQSTDDKSIHVSAVAHGDGLTVMQWRSLTGENMKDPEGEIFFPDKNFDVIQLQRVGKRLIMRIGRIGEPLKAVGSHIMTNMPDEALVGVFICSHDPEVTEQARIWDVHIDIPSSGK